VLWRSLRTNNTGLPPENFGVVITDYSLYTTSATKTLSTAKVAPAFATALLMSVYNFYTATLPGGVVLRPYAPGVRSYPEGPHVVFRCESTSSAGSLEPTQWLEGVDGLNVYGHALADSAADVNAWPFVVAVRALL
jgi:hypothetical protein